MNSIPLPRIGLLVMCCAALSGCDDREAGVPVPAVDCRPEQSECSYLHDFGRSSIEAGAEDAGQCYGFKLGNSTDLWVNTVELENDGGFHHSNWFFVPEKMYAFEGPQIRCKEIDFSELDAALAGGVLFAQSTQSRTEAQRFPPGAAVRVPAYSRIITSAHLLNASPKQLQTGLRLRMRTLPPEQVRIRLAPLRLSYIDLRLPPQQHSEFTGECNFRDNFESILGEPFRLKLYYVLPHFHGLGERFRLEVAGGSEDGRMLYELSDGIGEAHGQTFDPPVDMGSGNGFRFTCGYNNPRKEVVRWGNGDQEMCVMLGFAESKARFDGVVSRDKTTGDRQGVSLHSGPCGVAIYPVEG